MEKINVEILKDEFIFWSRLGYGTDPPKRDENGRLTTAEPLSAHSKYHRDMAKFANVKIHTATVCLGWMGENEYDYDTCDRILDEIFKDNEDILFIPRVKLNAPIDWCRENPSELWVYPHGPKNIEDIRVLVGTSKQDRIGAGGSNESCIARQSLCSQKWLEDVTEAFKRFIEHVEAGPYANRIIGYHFGYGKAGETHPWSRHGINGDFGISAKENFLKWAVNRYGGEETVKERWGVSVLNLDTIPIPTQKEFLEKKDTLSKFFYQDTVGNICYDYTLFAEETHINNITAFSKLIKKKTGKLAGIFHGYVMHSGANYVGHTDMQKILDIPTIDFIAAPKSYYRYEVGEPCTSYCVPMSVNRKKLWIEEIDIRTHLSKLESVSVNRKADSFEETRVLFWREFARCAMTGSGQWWMDLGGGWYNEQQILEEIAKINDIKHKIDSQKSESISEILIVLDEIAMRRVTPDHSLFLRLLQNFVCEMNLVGAPSDVYLMSDLENLDLSKYKVIAFLDAFELSKDVFMKLNINPKATIIWNYAAGIMGKEFGTLGIEELTGFKVRELKSNNSFPYIEILNPEKVLMRYDEAEKTTHCDMPELCDIPKTGVAIAERTSESGSKVVYAALPSLSSNMLRKIIEDAGVKCIAPLGCSVYGDSRFIGIFSSTDVDGEVNITGAVIDAISNKSLTEDTIKLHMKKKDMRVFLRTMNTVE